MVTGAERKGEAEAVSKDDPDLVAYWTFDEGEGYLIKDVSNHGHDLLLTSEPRWQASLVAASLPGPAVSSHSHSTACCSQANEKLQPCFLIMLCAARDATWYILIVHFLCLMCSHDDIMKLLST